MPCQILFKTPTWKEKKKKNAGKKSGAGKTREKSTASRRSRALSRWPSRRGGGGGLLREVPRGVRGRWPWENLRARSFICPGVGGGGVTEVVVVVGGGSSLVGGGRRQVGRRQRGGYAISAPCNFCFFPPVAVRAYAMSPV